MPFTCNSVHFASKGEDGCALTGWLKPTLKNSFFSQGWQDHISVTSTLWQHISLKKKKKKGWAFFTRIKPAQDGGLLELFQLSPEKEALYIFDYKSIHTRKPRTRRYKINFNVSPLSTSNSAESTHSHQSCCFGPKSSKRAIGSRIWLNLTKPGWCESIHRTVITVISQIREESDTDFKSCNSWLRGSNTKVFTPLK